MHDERRLRDILSCAEEIATYLGGYDLERFRADRLRQRAIERLLTIIGEAAKQLDDATRSAIDQPWREIIRFRDKGIHQYDSLSADSLFAIATQSVPELQAAIVDHLAKRR